MGLSAAVQAQLDSIYATGRWTVWHFPKMYDLAKEKLEGRVLYWYLAEGLIVGRLSGVRDTDEIIATIEKSL